MTNYKYGIRVERTKWSFALGIILVWYGEKALILQLGIFEVLIGKVYSQGS